MAGTAANKQPGFRLTAPPVPAGANIQANHQIAYVNAQATAGSQLFSAAATNATGATLLSALTDNGGAAQAIAAGNTITINGATITFAAGAEARSPVQAPPGPWASTPA